MTFIISGSRHRTLSALVLGVFILALIAFAGSGPATAADETPEWVWTKENPKPVWWTWGDDYEKDKPVRGGYFQTASANYIGLMNPNHWPVNDWVSMGFFYEKLIYTDGNFRPTVPWTVQSWEYVDDVTVIMKLKKGIKFHDGSSFDAAAVKYQIEWIMDPKSGTWSRAWLRPVKSIEVVDQYTVKWTFKEPWAGFLGIIANVPGYVLSAEGLKGDAAITDAKKLEAAADKARKKAAKGDEKAKQAAIKAEEKAKAAAELAKGKVSLDVWAVGTGPYMVEEARPGNYLKVKRNPNWWFGKSIGGRKCPILTGLPSWSSPTPRSNWPT